MNSTIHTGKISSAIKSMVDAKTGKHVAQFILTGLEEVKDGVKEERHQIRLFDPGKYDEVLNSGESIVVYGKKTDNGPGKQCVIEAYSVGRV